MSVVSHDNVRWFADLNNQDVAVVGGKNASLGEMVRSLAGEGIRVPDGFATTAGAYRRFLAENDLEGRIRALLGQLHGGTPLEWVGAQIREAISAGRFSEELQQDIRQAYAELSSRYGVDQVDVAVRSSATAEDLPEASFAGQQESFLNIQGGDALLHACRRCYASLFTDRAIAYRNNHGFDHLQVALSVGVQKMVRSDLAGAGVAFTIDTDTGFPRVVLIDAAWGLGESVVQGTVDPDEYRVFKPFLARAGSAPILQKTLGGKAHKVIYSGGDDPTEEIDTDDDERGRFVLSNDEIVQLGRWCVAIERHYGRPMDVEWAKDGERDELFIVQARPETVQARKALGTLKTYRLLEQGERLISGLAIGQAIAAGLVCRIEHASDIDRFEEGAVLVTGMTDPDWVPIMKKAAAIVTDHGGRTSHAAIVSRELGVPAIVGTGHATERLSDGQQVTISCVEGEQGHVYEGCLDFEAEELDVSELPETRTKILMNIASPAAAMRWWKLPVQGIGLARMEYVISHVIGVHPMALVRFDTLEDQSAKADIEERTRGFDDKREYFVHHLAQGIALIAASQHPKPVIVRTSDFKTNEYAQLLGGQAFEPHEENPMIGWRGASRYYDDDYRDGFALECEALRRVRDERGFTNVVVMIPFCRTPEEADEVLRILAEHGLERGRNGLEVYVMGEIPSNVLLAREFAARFDGFSIGSNDLTQLVLGVSRDSEKLTRLFDERHPAVKRAIRMLVQDAGDVPVGLCGQAPSDHPEFAEFLVEAGLKSISVDPDSVVDVLRRVAATEARLDHQQR